MGEAKRRGTYAERKKEGEIKTMALLAERQIRLDQLEKERKEAWDKMSPEAKAFALLSVGVSFEVLINMGLLTSMDDVGRDSTVSEVLMSDHSLLDTTRNKLYGIEASVPALSIYPDPNEITINPMDTILSDFLAVSTDTGSHISEDSLIQVDQ